MRWLAVLPAAVVAALLVQGIGWLGEVLLRVRGQGNPDWYVYVASGAISTGAFALMGTVVAPSRKLETAIALSLLITAWSSFTAAGLWLTGNERATLYGVSTLFGALLCVPVCMKAKNGEFDD